MREKEQRSTPAATAVKVLAVLALCLLAPAATRAQWTTPDSGGNTSTTHPGNVGIGTSTPAFPLTVVKSVNGSVVTAVFNTADGANAQVGGVISRTTDFSGKYLSWGVTAPSFSLSGYGETAYFHSAGVPLKFGSTTAHDLLFFTGGIANTRMTITGAGNVGVGTASPASILTVNLNNADYTNAGGAGSHFVMTNPNATGQNVISSMINGVTVAKWRTDYAGNVSWVAGAGYHAFYTGGDVTSGSAKMMILNNGKVGIGNSAPTYKLDVDGQVHSTGGFVFPDGSVQTTAAGGGGGGTLTGITAGAGLTGGGTSGSPTIDIGAGTGLTVGADSVSVNYGSAAGTAVQGNTTLTVTAGQGMTDGGQVTLGAGGTLTLTNNDRGSDQFIFKNVKDESGAVKFSAANNDDSLSFAGAGGTTVTFVPGEKKIVINGASGWTAAGGSASLSTTDAAAKVGIGTATPAVKLAVGGAGVNVTGTDAWVENNLHVQGPESLSGNTDRGRLRVGTAWGYAGLYSDTSSAGRGNDLVLGSSSGTVRVGPGAGVAQNLSVPNGDISASGTITGGTITATYQDVAEWVPTVQKLAPGTVVILDSGRTNHVMASATAYDTKVAGVVSAEPGVILGVAGDDKVKVATTGRVKVKVDASRGAIKVGDLLVTSEVEGVAMKSVAVDLGGVSIHRPGTIIGKALEPLEKGAGEILVLLSLQ